MCLCAQVMVHGYLIQHTGYVLHYLQVSEVIIILLSVIATPTPLDCGQPVLSPNVSVVSTTGTAVGDMVTLQCEDGLFPVIPVLIACNSAGVWSPNSAELVCFSIQGIILYDSCHVSVCLSSIARYSLSCIATT